MKTHIRGWGDGRHWTLDTETAAVSESATESRNGWFFHPRRVEQWAGPPFVAVYSDGSRIWFQAGADRWPLEELTFIREADSERVVCRFTVLREDKAVVDFLYFGPLSEEVNQNDPTFDPLDEELEDFLLFMAVNGNKEQWRHDALEQWR